VRERLLAATFAFWQRLGLHVTANHFYEPVPDTRELSAGLWETAELTPGIDVREAFQLALLTRFAERYATEYQRFASQPTGHPFDYHLDNTQFGKVDAEVLYCFVRDLRPRRIIEIGSGHSTLITALAIAANRVDDPGYACEFVCVEPFPNATLRAGVPGVSELVRRKVQDVPLSRFTVLEDGDILFIDSSHVLKIGSDVQYEFLAVVPRLAPGVLVHVHDIFLPGEYPRHMVLEWHRFWTEQYLLAAFLSFNRCFEVVWGSCFMHLHHAEELAAAFPSYGREGWPSGLPPSSLWMRRVS
jgi:predicted O-methyltransferase YrrM